MSFTSASPVLARSRWADVAVVAAAQFLGGLGTFVVMVAQVLLLQQRGASGIEVSALVIAEALPIVALGKVAGLLVDRVDSRVLLVVSGLGQAASCLALGVASDRIGVIAGVLALATCTAVSTPTRQALLPTMVTRDDLPRANAVGQTAGSIGMMAGPALAGFLVGGLGPQWTSWSAAIVFLVAVLSAFAIRTRRGGRREATAATTTPTTATTVPANTDESATPVGAVATGAATVRAWRLRDDDLLRSCVWGLTSVMAAASAVNVVLVFFVMGTLGSSPQVYGIIDGTWMVGMLGGAWLVGLGVKAATMDGSVARGVMFSAGTICAMVIAVGTVRNAWWIVPCYLVGGAANAGINVLTGTLLGRRVPAEARGRANAVLGMRIQAGALVGFVAGGLLLNVATPRTVVLACGVLGLLVAIVLMPAVQRASSAVAQVPADAPPAPVA